MPCSRNGQCAVLLFVGLMGVVIVRTTEQRPTMATILLNVYAISLLLAVAALLAGAGCWSQTERPPVSCKR